MLTLELLMLTAEYVQYKFYPEGDRDNFGIVQVGLKDFERALIKDAEDVGSEYKGQAWAQVTRLIKRGEFPAESGSAWG